MAIRITDNEYEQYVSGDFNNASIICDDRIRVSIGGIPDMQFSVERAADLRDVLIAAIDLAYPVYVLTVEGEAVL